MIHIHIKLFALLRDLCKKSEISLQLAAGASLKDAKTQLLQQFPELGSHLHLSLMAVNQEYADDSHILADGDEVALFPPVSGG